MAFSLFLSSSLKSPAIALTILSTFVFFLVLKPCATPIHPFTNPLIPRRSLLNNTATPLSCSSILQIPLHDRCSFSLLNCNSDGLINYFSLHFCHFNQNSFLSIPFLSLSLLLHFYLLIKTAQDHFSVVVTKLSSHLNLSPSMGAVTLLALGNGAPDVFSSVAAVRGGQPRTGFGAILSAGTFVSAFVVGFVAIYAAPFSVDPASFVRDVLFYLIAAMFLFYVYLSAEIWLWQAVGFVGFYLFFVGFVFWMDLGMKNKKSKGEVPGLVGDVEEHKGLSSPDYKNVELMGEVAGPKMGTHFSYVFSRVCFLKILLQYILRFGCMVNLVYLAALHIMNWMYGI